LWINWENEEHSVRFEGKRREEIGKNGQHLRVNMCVSFRSELKLNKHKSLKIFSGSLKIENSYLRTRAISKIIEFSLLNSGYSFEELERMLQFP